MKLVVTDMVDGIDAEAVGVTISVVEGTAGSGGGAVDSVNSQTGVVVLTASDVGADASGAAATAQAAAIAAAATDATTKADAAQATAESFATAGDATEASARTAAISAAVNALINAAPGTLDTLGEIATALAADESTASALATTVAGKVAKSTYDANTILKADTDDTPSALTVAASTIVGRLAAGGIAALSVAQVKTLLAIANTDVSGLGTAATVDTGTASGKIPLLTTGGILPLTEMGTGTPAAGKYVDGAAGVWTTLPAGGSSVQGFPLDKAPSSASAWDDDFTAGSLDAKWVAATSAATAATTVTLENESVKLEPTASGTGSTASHGGFGIAQVAPTGSFTLTARVFDNPITGEATSQRAGIFVASTATPNCVVIGQNFNLDWYAEMIDVASYSTTAEWGAFNGTQTLPKTKWSPLGAFFRIRWNSSTSTVFLDYGNGAGWTNLGSKTSWTQPTRIGIVLYSHEGNMPKDHSMNCSWFRVVEGTPPTIGN